MTLKIDFFPIGSTCKLKLYKLTLGSEYLDSAHIKGRLELNGKPVGQTFKFNYLNKSKGTYVGTLDVPSNLIDGQVYSLALQVKSGMRRLKIVVRRKAALVTG